MGLSKFIRELAKSVPAAKPIIQTFEEIGHSLKQSFPSAKPIKDLKSQIADAKKTFNATKKEMDKLTPQHTLDINYNSQRLSFDKLIEDQSTIGKLKPSPPSGGSNPSGGWRNPGSNGPMLGGGGGLDPFKNL